VEQLERREVEKRRKVGQSHTAVHGILNSDINIRTAACGETLVIVQGGILMTILRGLHEKHAVRRGIWYKHGICSRRPSKQHPVRTATKARNSALQVSVFESCLRK
jgi:hypothetical protein